MVPHRLLFQLPGVDPNDPSVKDRSRHNGCHLTNGPARHVEIGQRDVWKSITHVLVDAGDSELRREDDVVDAGNESLWTLVGRAGRSHGATLDNDVAITVMAMTVISPS